MTTNDPNTIAKTFNEYFCNIASELINNLPPTEPTYNTLIPFNSRTMALFPTTPAELKSIFNSIKPNSNLKDILPINIIKECADIFAEPLSEAINKCFVEGDFPNEFKCAKIIPIFKKGDSLSINNYRPISILPDFSKIVEQCIYERIHNFTSKYNLIDKRQFGFQRKSGTLSAAMCLLNDICLSIDQSNKNIVGCLFLDISKAFDTILCYLLKGKMYRHGIRGMMI